MKEFTVRPCANGFLLTVSNSTAHTFSEDEYVFNSEAKLLKAFKLALKDLQPDETSTSEAPF